MNAFCVILVLTVANSILSTAIANFQRECSNSLGKDKTFGILYYQAPDKVLVHVQHPVNQIMLVKANKLIIYYPDDNKAFRITSSRPVSLPFAQIFAGIVKEDYGLSDLGYELARSEFKDDTLFTYWDPPTQAKKLLGDFILGEMDERLVYIETQKPKGGTASKSFFKDHLELHGVFFPREVLTEIYTDYGISTEHTVYKDVELNIHLPAWVLEFSIPDSAEVEEIEW